MCVVIYSPYVTNVWVYVCRGKICRVPLFRTSSTPRREALLSAMSEEHDITDMQGKLRMPPLFSFFQIQQTIAACLFMWLFMRLELGALALSVSESFPLFRNWQSQWRVVETYPHRRAWLESRQGIACSFSRCVLARLERICSIKSVSPSVRSLRGFSDQDFGQ